MEEHGRLDLVVALDADVQLVQGEEQVRDEGRRARDQPPEPFHQVRQRWRPLDDLRGALGVEAVVLDDLSISVQCLASTSSSMSRCTWSRRSSRCA
ncbi:MAG: hypothetical protein HC923_00005, partial [Myxococcales bacterium]|nr:hypothetical protein [Myxococcales bacterium]